MKRLLLLLFTTALLHTAGTAQSDASIIARMQGLKLEEDMFLSIDGVAISTNTYNEPYVEEGLLKKYKRYRFRDPDLTGSDSSLPFRNMYARKQEMEAGVSKWQNIYIFENRDKGTTAVVFIQTGKNDHTLERKVLQLMYNRQIPDSVFVRQPLDTINFAGRKIRLGDSCVFRGVNRVYCENYGEMNWSMHPTEQDAKLAFSADLKRLEARMGKDITGKDSVAVIFEKQPVKALKIIYKNRAMAAVRDNNVLSIYYVVAPVRGYFLYCTMSFWNRQVISPGGLTPLLDQVMSLSK